MSKTITFLTILCITLCLSNSLLNRKKSLKTHKTHQNPHPANSTNSTMHANNTNANSTKPANNTMQHNATANTNSTAKTPIEMAKDVLNANGTRDAINKTGQLVTSNQTRDAINQTKNLATDALNTGNNTLKGAKNFMKTGNFTVAKRTDTTDATTTTSSSPIANFSAMIMITLTALMF